MEEPLMTSRFCCLLLVSALLLLVDGSRAQVADPPEVNVSQPLSRQVTDYEDFTGRVEPSESVELRARISGAVEKVAFRAGAAVKKGDLLFEIDSRTCQAELNKARAELERTEAQIKKAVADVEGAKKLLDSRVISQAEYARTITARDDAEASRRVARAALDLAQLKLDSTKVAAPINGTIGKPLVAVGGTVTANTTALATIISTDPVRVAFDIDERTALRLSRVVSEGKVKVKKDATYPVLVGLADEEGWPHRSKIDFADLRFGPQGTARREAVFANPDAIFLPGMFARVRLLEGEPYKALLVSIRAVGRESGESYLYVVTPKNVVERRAVKLGRQHGSLVAVKEGLTAADWVIVEHYRMIDRGTAVTPKKVPCRSRHRAREAERGLPHPRGAGK